jgi:tRNA(Ile)-lysidine synthase
LKIVNLGVLEQFLNHIERHQLCKTSDKILLAVSGGMDSMIMVDFFLKAGFDIGIVHANFQLRGAASDADEEMVAALALRLAVPFFSTRFDTRRLAEEGQKSTQVAARELRYGFFREVSTSHGYDYIATGHHANDNLETIILNLVRGTGIEGLGGIPVKQGNLIRPLLFATRDSLQAYAHENGIVWREDASNETDDYSRNYIRHKIIPPLKLINPNLEGTFVNSMERIWAGVELSRKSISVFYSRVVSESDGRLIIDKEKLLADPYPAVMMWEILKRFGFHYDVCKKIVSDHQSGKQFHGATYTLTVDRSSYILEKSSLNNSEEVVRIERGQDHALFMGDKIHIKEINAEAFKLNPERNFAQVDADKVIFPLTWRRWLPGDSIIPLGMKTAKKVSDILTDARVSVPDKGKMTVLESGNEIIWLVGMRINDNFKITRATTRVLILELNLSYL